MKNKDKIMLTFKIIIPVFIVICLFSAGVTTGIITFEKPESIIEDNENDITATLNIIFSEDEAYSKEFKIESLSVYDLLLEAEKIGDISIDQTYWEQFDSYVIDSITYNDKKYEGDSSHYWGYYINGEAAMDGADKIIINDNDLIEWRYESF